MYVKNCHIYIHVHTMKKVGYYFLVLRCNKLYNVASVLWEIIEANMRNYN